MTIRARYPGRCYKCGQPIRPGDTIDWDKDTRQTRHIECPAKAEAPKTIQGSDDATIKLYYVSRYRAGGPAVGTTAKAPNGAFVTVVRTTARWVSQDEVDDNDDFNNGGDPYYRITAYCRPATDEEAAPLKAEAQAAEARKAAQARVREIAAIIEKTGECPTTEPIGPNDRGLNENYRPGFVLKGERLIDSGNIYGGGSWFVIEPDYIWYVRNNGGDGAMWDANNVQTGGAGAIGWRVPANEGLAAELRRLEAVLKTKK
jgi:hypothetical protein